MKTFALLVVSVVLVGCASVEYPLQPGDSVVFKNKERADNFRQLSGNDQGHTNRWVEIDQPTSLLIKR